MCVVGIERITAPQDVHVLVPKFVNMLYGKIMLHDFICSVADKITVAYQLITKMVRFSWTIQVGTI